MIDTCAATDRPQTVNSAPVTFVQMYCGACRGKLARVSLTPGACVEDRCHHSIVGDDGRRRTCGHVTRLTPTR